MKKDDAATEKKPLSEEMRWKLLRKKVLSEWRVGEDRGNLQKFTRTAGEMVPVILKKYGIDQRMSSERLEEAWCGIVGDFIAQHSRPARLERRVLWVAVSQSAVKYTLERELKASLLKKLKDEFGEDTINGVRFIAG
ncbi:DUF721 domain-containing protein [Verrucomicrobiales bacterium]|nr:DUF721 domain-containing protein [Verrucomicrobiales bacterium]